MFCAIFSKILVSVEFTKKFEWWRKGGDISGNRGSTAIFPKWAVLLHHINFLKCGKERKKKVIEKAKGRHLSQTITTGGPLFSSEGVVRDSLKWKQD